MKTKTVLPILIVLSLFSLIGAAGIASPYWESNPLEMHYGETRIISLNLQNMVGNEDVTVKVIIKQGSDIVTLPKDTYTAKVGTSDTVIPLTIAVPENYGKQLQTVEIEAKTVTSGEGGMVTLGTGWTTKFDVVLSQKSSSTQSSSSTGKIIALIIAIIVLIIMITFIMKRKKSA
ncbi:MAG: hypothetical protein AABW63_01425 [Nanoarchaeota archaeon]